MRAPPPLARLLSLLLPLAACSDHSIVATSYGPVVEITSHADGAVEPEGKEIIVVARVSHEGAPLSELSLAWALNTEPVCEEAESLSPDEEGLVRCDLGEQPLGTFYVSLSAVDGSDRAATDEVMIETQVASPPEAIILSPDPQDALLAGETITFEGSVSDPEDAPEELLAWWESSLDGELTEVSAAPDELGRVEGQGSLSAGEHTLTLWVEDRMGKLGSDAVTLQVD